jgi:hypothetical protein
MQFLQVATSTSITQDQVMVTRHTPVGQYTASLGKSTPARIQAASSSQVKKSGIVFFSKISKNILFPLIVE